MNVLVTGHNGFIGRSLVKSFVEEGNKVFILRIKNRKNTIPDNATSIDFDEKKIDVFIALLKEAKINGVIHLASKFTANHKSNQVAKLIDSNFRFGAMVLDAAADANVKWFLNTGTFWQHYENKVYSPVNLYSAIKQGFQTIAQFYIETGNMKFVTLILLDTYGPGDKRLKILNLWEKISKTGETMKMTGGEQIMKINYIDDIVSAYVMLANLVQNKPGSVENGQIFSLDSDENYTVKQLAGLFETTLNRKLNIEWGALPYREREIMNPLINGKLVPGWSPKVSLSEGLEKTFKKS